MLSCSLMYVVPGTVCYLLAQCWQYIGTLDCIRILKYEKYIEKVKLMTLS